MSHSESASGSDLKTASTVKVRGLGELEFVPDTAALTLGVDITHPVLETAKTDATTQMQAILAALRNEGIAKSDIKTSRFWVQVVRENKKNYAPGRITGYRVSNAVTVTIREVEKAGEVLNAALETGANDVGGVRFYMRDEKPLLNEALKLAVEDATARAEVLANAAGVNLGPILSMSDESDDGPTYRPSLIKQLRLDDAMAAPPIEAGTAVISANVWMVFDLVH
jgi:uncharacterized protein